MVLSNLKFYTKQEFYMMAQFTSNLTIIIYSNHNKYHIYLQNLVFLQEFQPEDDQIRDQSYIFHKHSNLE